MRFFLKIILFLTLSHAYADTLSPVKLSKKDLKKDKDLIAVATKLQSSPLVKMKLKKTVFNVITDDEKSYDGELKVTRGNLRLNIDHPEKFMVLVQKSQIWVVNFDPDDTGKANQIVHIKSGKEKVHQLLLNLLDGEGLLKNFSLKNSLRKEDELIFELKPISEIDEIARVQLTAEEKNHEVKNITYWDAQDNKTVFDFSEVEFLKKKDPDAFKYTPPKGVKVEEL